MIKMGVSEALSCRGQETECSEELHSSEKRKGALSEEGSEISVTALNREGVCSATRAERVAGNLDRMTKGHLLVIEPHFLAMGWRREHQMVHRRAVAISQDLYCLPKLEFPAGFDRSVHLGIEMAAARRGCGRGTLSTERNPVQLSVGTAAASLCMGYKLHGRDVSTRGGLLMNRWTVRQIGLGISHQPA